MSCQSVVFCFGLPSVHLCRKGECVNQEKLREFLQLLDISTGKLIVIVSALVAIEADEVRPCLEISGQTAIRRQQVDTFGERLSGKRRIKFACRNIDGFSEHRRCCIGVLAPGIIQSLQERPGYCSRNAVWSTEDILFWVLGEDCEVKRHAYSVEVADHLHNPLRVVGGMVEAHTRELPAPVASKSRNALSFLRAENSDRIHRDPGRVAVRTISYQRYRHDRSLGAPLGACRRQA